MKASRDLFLFGRLQNFTFQLLDPFWPQQIDEEKSYGEVSVVLEKTFEFSHCFERMLKVTKSGSDDAMKVSLLQIKSWKARFVFLMKIREKILKLAFYSKNLLFRSPDQIVDVAGNIITSFKQQNPDFRQAHSPIVLNCMTGGADRSGVVTFGISAMFATQMRKPTLLSKKNYF